MVGNANSKVTTVSTKEKNKGLGQCRSRCLVSKFITSRRKRKRAWGEERGGGEGRRGGERKGGE